MLNKGWNACLLACYHSLMAGTTSGSLLPPSCRALGLVLNLLNECMTVRAEGVQVPVGLSREERQFLKKIELVSQFRSPESRLGLSFLKEEKTKNRTNKPPSPKLASQSPWERADFCCYAAQGSPYLLWDPQTQSFAPASPTPSAVSSTTSRPHHPTRRCSSSER